MTTTPILTPIHRHDANFYEVNGNFKIRETQKNYIIELEHKKITIPKTNTVQIPTSLYELPDDLVFFPILHHDIGTVELIYTDSKNVNQNAP
jgi:hypothetical protein